MKRDLREIAPGGGYYVGSSNTVSDFVKVENYEAMRATALKYGTSPISM